MALNETVIDSVANANFKTAAEMGVLEAQGHQSRLNAIKEASIGQIVNRMNSMDPSEAHALAKLSRSDQSSQAQSDALAASIAKALAQIVGLPPAPAGGPTT